MLFSPITIGNVELPNRIVVAPMCQYSAIDGCPSNWHYHHLGMLALSGAGMLVFESTSVNLEGRISQGDLVLESEKHHVCFSSFVRHLNSLAPSKLVLQLNHAGRKGSVNYPWVENGSNLNADSGCWKTYSASAIARDEGWQLPKEMTEGDIQNVKAAFIKSAQMAVKAGFDGVEVHMAHGYLLHQFLSPISNQRTDKFGGNQENRNRFPLQIVDEIKQCLPRNTMLGVRITGKDCLDGGLDLSDAVELSFALRELAVDYICVSSGGIKSKTNLIFSPGWQVHLAEKIKKQVGLPTRTAGKITEPLQAETVLLEGRADLIAIGRQLIKEPWFVYRAAKELEASIEVPNPYLRCL
jgi:2,4-dienoyl-CoA reductase-like NADH-dependent reductase (Old Yellow Enzyme family)